MKKEPRYVYDNHGTKTEIIPGLKEGDILICHTTQRSSSGLGLWSQERYDSFEKGKEYPVHHITNWDGVMVAYVVDEDSCCTWATPGTFKLKKK